MRHDGTYYWPIHPQLHLKLVKLLHALEQAIEQAGEDSEAPKRLLRALNPCRICCVFDNGFNPFNCKSPNGHFKIHVVLTDQDVRPGIIELLPYYVGGDIDPDYSPHA